MGQVVEVFEQEEACLGAIVFAPDELREVAEILVPEDFAQVQFREIYSTMLALENDGVRVDSASLVDRMDPARFRDLIHGLDLISPANSARHYAKAVKERSILRRINDEATKLVKLAREWRGSATELLNETEQRILSIRTDRTSHGFKPIGEIVARTVMRLDKMRDSPGTVTGLATGLRDFDALTGGFQPGQLIILAARPKMGKTACALQIAEHVSEHAGAVGLFSLEMTEDELGPRVLANLARVNGMKFRNAATITERENDRIVRAAQLLQPRPLHIDDTLHTTIGEIRSKARRLAVQCEKAGNPLKLIILDYLQLAGEYGEHREQAIAEISRGLKALAKELHLPVMSLSQLNRGLEKRPDKRPIPSDLRDSGSLEQDADMVVFLYRDDVYHPNASEKGKAELIVSLTRSGAPGTVEVKFEEAFMRFSDLPHQEQLEMPTRDEPPHSAEGAR